MAELFPTLIRSTAVGLGATASKIGGLAAPFIAGLRILGQLFYLKLNNSKIIESIE